MRHTPFTRAELISSINKNRASIQKVKEAIEAWVDFLAAMEKKEQEMLAKYEQLERIDALLDELMARFKAMVLLNLRGKVFPIELKYLLSDTLWCSYFPVMLLNEPDPKSGTYFIDCASEGFDRILDCTKEDKMNYNLKGLNAFEIGSINRNLLYFRLPYRRNEYQCISTFDARTDEEDVIFNMVQLRDGRLLTSSRNPLIKNGVMRIWNTTTFVCEQTIVIIDCDIECLLQLQDGRLCVGALDVSQADRPIDIWDLDDGEVVLKLLGHTHRITRLVQLVDGRLCSVGNDKTLRVWDVTTGECLKLIVLHGELPFLMIHLSNGLVATNSLGTTILLWDPSSWECVWTINTGKRIIHILEIDGGAIISSHYGPSSLKFWDVGTGVLLRSILYGERWIGQLLQLQDGRLCVDVIDGIKILSIESEEWEQILEKKDNENTNPCRFLQLEDGRLMSSVSLINVWSTGNFV